jgi:peptidoglycan/xylan/chitin deacetylase (PgdA/CDA1 family)
MRKVARVMMPCLVAVMLFVPLAVSIVSINFDDGYRSDLVAKQIMDQYGFKATAFIVVNPKCLGGAEGRMNHSEITLLYKDGWDIESHGYNHKRPADLTHKNLRFSITYLAICSMHLGRL